MSSLTSYVSIGRSGLRVSPLTLGAMTFGEDAGWGASVETSEAMLDAYLDAGGNSIDTANVYTNGHSEKIIGDFFAARPGTRERVVLGTKFFCNLIPGDPNAGGAGRKAVIGQFNESLRRLQTDYVDLLWLHNWDRFSPIEETVRVLDDLVTAGAVRYVGFSDVPPGWPARRRPWPCSRTVPITAFQLEYSLLERTVEAEFLPMTEQLGIGVMPWSPLRMGWLSGKYTRQNDVEASRGALAGSPSDRQWDVTEEVARVAAELETRSAAVALAWVRARPGVASTLIGARTPEQLRANIAALELELPDEHLTRLDEASAPVLPFPSACAPFNGALQYPDTTVDGVHYPALTALTGSATRY